MSDKTNLRGKLVDLLSEYNPQDVEKYAGYIDRLISETRNGQLKNAWASKFSEEVFAKLFKRVANEGLVFDGVHVILTSTGIHYDYIAYKNKMLIAYPESKVDVMLVYKGDEFTAGKKDGEVTYTHKIGNPFEQKDSDIVGGYAVIKNQRGHFLTLLSAEDIEKHRKVAKTDFIWRQWFKEMALKTVIKKACKQHFADVYENIEQMDNDNYDVDQSVEMDLSHKQALEKIDNLKDLSDYYAKHEGEGSDFAKAVAKRKAELQST